MPFSSALVPAVLPWFDDAEVRHWLGGPEWPAQLLRSVDEGAAQMFRGRMVMRSVAWLAIDDEDVAVGLVGGDVYDRWSRYDGSQAEPVSVDVEPGPAMGLAYVADPARRGQGFGRAMLHAVVDRTDLFDVRLFTAGIDADNTASRRCAAGAGFVPERDDADWENTVYYRRGRAAEHPRGC